MTGQHRGGALAGKRRAYDPCPGCGHARVKHLSAPAGGCTVFGFARDAAGRAVPGSAYGQCPCGRTRLFDMEAR